MPDPAELQRILVHLRSAHHLAAVGSWEGEYEGDAGLRWSDEVRAITGWTEAREPTYEELVAMIHPDDRPLFLEMRARALAGDRPYAIDLRMLRTDGAQRRVHLAGDVVRDEDGVAFGLVGAVQDRTEEIEGLRQLRLNEVVRRDLLQRLLLTADIERDRLARHLASGPIERLVEIEQRFEAAMPNEPPKVWVDALGVGAAGDRVPPPDPHRHRG